MILDAADFGALSAANLSIVRRGNVVRSGRGLFYHGITEHRF